jgi:signal transduction histidine kinase
LNPEVKETLDILKREIVNCENIINRLLGYASNKPPILRQIKLKDFIPELLTNMKVPDGINIINLVTGDFPVIHADKDQLATVFRNLVINAIQAMSENGTLEIKSEIKDKNNIALSFSDTGVGISKDNIPNIFEPLFTTKAKGIGLGLAVIKTLVEKHGGKITVQSKVGKGSTFTVNLPINNYNEKQYD